MCGVCVCVECACVECECVCVSMSVCVCVWSVCVCVCINKYVCGSQCCSLEGGFSSNLSRSCPQVGTVESFQGDERRVIIVSTVRSDLKADALDMDATSIDAFLQFDARHKLGFLRNPKRFNVSATRAQCLFILVGNPFVLNADRHWRAMLQYAFAMRCYTGVPFDPTPASAHARHLHLAFEALQLGKVGPAGDETAAGDEKDEDDEEAAIVEDSVPRLREDGDANC